VPKGSICLIGVLRYYQIWVERKDRTMEANSRWQVSGNAADRYEEFLVPTIFAPWTDVLLDLANIGQNESILDIACGTGIVARTAAERLGGRNNLVGVDLNGGMLDVAKKLNSEIDWVEADVTEIPFTDSSFDVAFCQQGLQFFPDKTKALREVKRVLRPNGRAIVSVARSLKHNPLMQSQVDAFSRHIGVATADAIRAVCGLSDRDQIVTHFLSARFKMPQVESVSLTLKHPDGRDFVKGLMSASPAASAIDELPNSKKNLICEDILDGFGTFYDGQKLEFPHVAHVVVASV